MPVGSDEQGEFGRCLGNYVTVDHGDCCFWRGSRSTRLTTVAPKGYPPKE